MAYDDTIITPSQAFEEREPCEICNRYKRRRRPMTETERTLIALFVVAALFALFAI